MFKWSVLVYTVNQSGNCSETVTMKDTQIEAEDLFYDTLSKVGGNPQTRFLRVELKNENGVTMDYGKRERPQIVTE